MQPSDTYREIGRYMGVTARSRTARHAYSLMQERRMSDWNEERPYTLLEYGDHYMAQEGATLEYVRDMWMRSRPVAQNEVLAIANNAANV